MMGSMGGGLGRLFAGSGGGSAAMAAPFMSKLFGSKGISPKTGLPDMRMNMNKGWRGFAKNSKFMRGGGALSLAAGGLDLYNNMTDDSLSVGGGLLKTLDQNKATAVLAALSGIFTGGTTMPAALAVGGVLDAFLPTFGSYANGGPVTQSGMAMVGERGPELVALGRGSHVVPNHYLGGFEGGATNMKISDPDTHRALMTIAAHLDSIKTNTASTAKGVNNISITTGQ